MPLKKLEALIEQLLEEIRTNYESGDLFLTIRQIAAHYGVSVQTANNAMKRIEKMNMVSLTPKIGTIVKSTVPLKSVLGNKLAVVSNLNDPQYSYPFTHVIEEEASRDGVEVLFEEIHEDQFRGLELAYHIQGLGAQGAVLLSFTESALALYHLYREDFDFVSDIHYPELPMIASVHTDDYRHSLEAGKLHARQGYDRVLVVGYKDRDESKRLQGYCDGMGKNGDGITYVEFSHPAFLSTVEKFFLSFTENSAFFSADYPLNGILASKMLQHRIPVKNDNFLVYDGKGDLYRFHDLPPVKTVAPSLTTLGHELYRLLLSKWQLGHFQEPLQQLI